jgi:tetratricopeptide (TPR) repeat protein
MGKLILCSGVRTKRPYGFASTGVRVYSIEELCYYLYHHVYLIDEDMFCDSLIDWIKTELKLEDRAEKLRLIKEKKPDLKTMVTIILCSADYYTEQEIKNVLKMLDEIIGMPMIKRSCLKANNCLQNGQFREAATEYESILNSKEAVDLTPEAYGDILHNMAVAKMHITGLKEAPELFGQAFERNHREESLRQYLYALRLVNNDAFYHEKVVECQIDEAFQKSIADYLDQKKEEAKYSEGMVEMQQLKLQKSQGKMNEYYKKTDEMIDSWKAKVRQI